MKLHIVLPIAALTILLFALGLFIGMSLISSHIPDYTQTVYCAGYATATHHANQIIEAQTNENLWINSEYCR